MGDGSIKSSMYFLCTKHIGRVYRITNDGIRSISDVRFFLSLALELILRGVTTTCIEHQSGNLGVVQGNGKNIIIKLEL